VVPTPYRSWRIQEKVIFQDLTLNPHSRSLGEGLNELRGKQVRIFYVFRPQRRIVLLDGMVKKRDDIPAAVLKRLRQLQREVK